MTEIKRIADRQVTPEAAQGQWAVS